MKTEVIQTRVTPDLKQRMLQSAELNGQSISEFIRFVFLTYEKQLSEKGENESNVRQ